MVFILKIFRQHPMLLEKFISKLRILGLFDPGRQILLVLAVQTQSQLTTSVTNCWRGTVRPKTTEP